MAYYEVYSSGKLIAEPKTWKTVISKVNELKKQGKHGSVIQTFPYLMKADLLIMKF